jgi:Tol biopolymer transport system component
MARVRHLIGLFGILACTLALSASSASATGIGQNGRIAFSSGGDLYTINADGTGLKHLVETSAFDGNLREPSFSGDGELIAFTSNAAGTDDIWVVDSDFATVPVRLTTETRSETEPAFQPFGNKIAYVSDLGTAAGELFLMDTDGSAQQQLTTTAEDERAPAWSQSGTDLVFVRSAVEGGPGDLVRLSPTGGGEQLITSGLANDREPSWYMGKIVFTRSAERSAGADLYQIKPDGSGLIQLTTTPGGELSPAGSPNGKRLAFVKDSQLLVGNSDATGAAVIPNAPGGVSDPDWEPIFQLNIGNTQRATNIEYEEHGTFAIVSFDTKFKTALPVVELWDGSALNTGIDIGPADDHFEIKIAGLEPDTHYDVKIVMNKAGGGTIETDPDDDLTTLQRNVTIRFQKVEMHSDSEASCGDFLFVFELSAASMINGDYTGNGEISICDGETWDPNDIAVPLTDIDGDTVTGYVLGVDDDWDCVAVYCNEYDFYVIGSDHTDFKEDGEWVEKTFVEDVGPNEYTASGETWKRKNTVWLLGGDDDELSFTWHYELQVSYS